MWSIDSKHSTARLFLASSKSTDEAVNVGVARTNGLIDQDTGDLSLSKFDFTIYPADKTAPSNPVFRFKSPRVVSLGLSLRVVSLARLR
jgi:hypothetical protein